MEKKLEQWLDRATGGIRFKPDRDAVRRELREHLEDKRADLQRIYHLSPEEAADMTLGQMGDAGEIGKALARVHRPWLGWLWQASQALAMAALVGFLLVIFSLGDDALLGDDPASELWDWDGYPGNSIVDWNYYAPGERGADRYAPQKDDLQRMAREYHRGVWVNGQHIGLRHAAIWQEGEREMLYLSLRLETPLFWERTVLWERWLTVTDSKGTTYSLENLEAEQPNRFFVNGYGPFHACMELRLTDLDPEAEWIRLDYGPEGEIFSLVAELEREAKE